MAEADSQHLSLLVDRLRSGDEAAREELIRAAPNRLERLTRKMLRGFPRVKRCEDTGDVLQNTLIRLDRALCALAPGSSRALFGLVAEQICRELLDPSRHYQGQQGPGHNHRSGAFAAVEEGPACPNPADPGPAPADLDRWTVLHSAAEHLPGRGA